MPYINFVLETKSIASVIDNDNDFEVSLFQLSEQEVEIVLDKCMVLFRFLQEKVNSVTISCVCMKTFGFLVSLFSALHKQVKNHTLANMLKRFLSCTFVGVNISCTCCSTSQTSTFALF